MNDRIKTIAYVAAAITVAGLAAASIAKVHLEEENKRLEIEKNMHLDLRAIRLAQEVMTQRIDNGEIRSLNDLASGIRNEIAFQKIAIREE